MNYEPQGLPSPVVILMCRLLAEQNDSSLSVLLFILLCILYTRTVYLPRFLLSSFIRETYRLYHPKDTIAEASQKLEGSII